MMWDWPGALAIVPRDPVIDGHVIVLPKAHVSDARTDPSLTGYVMTCAAVYAPDGANLITSIGRAATQTVMHLHVHVVPRRDGDQLSLPWDRR